MKYLLSTLFWCCVVGVGGVVGRALYLLALPDVNVVLLGALSVILTLANGFAFQKFRKIDDIKNATTLDSARLAKVRRFANRRQELFFRHWSGCIGSGIITAICAGLLKISALQADYGELLTICGYASGILLVLLAILINRDYFLVVKIHAELAQERESREQQRSFLQKVKA